MEEKKPFEEEFEEWFSERGWFHENTARDRLWMAWLMLAGAGVGVKVIKGELSMTVSAVANEYGE